MKININNSNKCRVKDLNFGDVFVANNSKYPYILTDSDSIYCKVEDGEWLCVALENGNTTSFDGNYEVVAVKNVELNYNL